MRARKQGAESPSVPTVRLLCRGLETSARVARKLAQDGGIEICGLLVDNGYFLELIQTRNKCRKGGGFAFYYNDIRAIVKMAKAFGHKIAGTFHSHPVSYAKPGDADIHYAVDNSLMLIFDVSGTRMGSLAH